MKKDGRRPKDLPGERDGTTTPKASSRGRSGGRVSGRVASKTQSEKSSKERKHPQTSELQKEPNRPVDGSAHPDIANSEHASQAPKISSQAGDATGDPSDGNTESSTGAPKPSEATLQSKGVEASPPKANMKKKAQSVSPTKSRGSLRVHFALLAARILPLPAVFCSIIIKEVVRWRTGGGAVSSTQ